MAKQGQDAIKLKISKVREVVPNVTSEKIQLVLHYYELNEELTIQAFLNDGAAEALSEWQQPDVKVKKKTKKQNRPAAATRPTTLTVKSGGKTSSKDDSESVTTGDSASVVSTPQHSNGDNITNSVPSIASSSSSGHPSPSTDLPTPSAVEDKPHVLVHAGMPTSALGEGEVPHASVHVPMTSATLEEGATDGHSKAAAAGAPVSSRQAQVKKKHGGKAAAGNKKEMPPRTLVEEKPVAVESTKNVTAASLGLDKLDADLKKALLNLTRSETLFGEEREKSQKAITVLFDNLRTVVNEREAELIFELDKSKKAANEWLAKRRKGAAVLKEKSDRFHSLKSGEVAQLKTDIKNFLAEKRHDDELSTASKFTCDESKLLQHLREFGSIGPVKRQHLISTSAVVANEVAVPSQEIAMRAIASTQTDGARGNLNGQHKQGSASSNGITSPSTSEIAVSGKKADGTAQPKPKRQERRNRSRDDKNENSATLNEAGDSRNLTINQERKVGDSLLSSENRKKSSMAKSRTAENNKSESSSTNEATERNRSQLSRGGRNGSNDRPANRTSSENEVIKSPKRPVAAELSVEHDARQQQTHYANGQDVQRSPRGGRGRGDFSNVHRGNGGGQWGYQSYEGYEDPRWRYSQPQQRANGGYDYYHEGNYRRDHGRQWNGGYEVYNSNWAGSGAHDQQSPQQWPKRSDRKPQRGQNNSNRASNRVLNKETAVNPSKEDSVTGQPSISVTSVESQGDEGRNRSESSGSFSAPRGVGHQESWADSVETAELNQPAFHDRDNSNVQPWATDVQAVDQ